MVSKAQRSAQSTTVDAIVETLAVRPLPREGSDVAAPQTLARAAAPLRLCLEAISAPGVLLDDALTAASASWLTVVQSLDSHVEFEPLKVAVDESSCGPFRRALRRPLVAHIFKAAGAQLKHRSNDSLYGSGVAATRKKVDALSIGELKASLAKCESKPVVGQVLEPWLEIAREHKKIMAKCSKSFMSRSDDFERVHVALGQVSAALEAARQAHVMALARALLGIVDECLRTAVGENTSDGLDPAESLSSACAQMRRVALAFDGHDVCLEEAAQPQSATFQIALSDWLAHMFSSVGALRVCSSMAGDDRCADLYKLAEGTGTQRFVQWLRDPGHPMAFVAHDEGAKPVIVVLRKALLSQLQEALVAMLRNVFPFAQALARLSDDSTRGLRFDLDNIILCACMPSEHMAFADLVASSYWEFFQSEGVVMITVEGERGETATVPLSWALLCPAMQSATMHLIQCEATLKSAASFDGDNLRGLSELAKLAGLHDLYKVNIHELTRRAATFPEGCNASALTDATTRFYAACCKRAWAAVKAGLTELYAALVRSGKKLMDMMQLVEEAESTESEAFVCSVKKIIKSKAAKELFNFFVSSMQAKTHAHVFFDLV